MKMAVRRPAEAAFLPVSGLPHNDPAARLDLPMGQDAL
jgi:hypothetical protein